MRPFLLFRDRDVDFGAGLPQHGGPLDQDLGVGTLLRAMAGGSDILLGIACAVFSRSLAAPGDIMYRQEILRDCMALRPLVAEIYEIADQAIRTEKQSYRGMVSSPTYTLHRAMESLRLHGATLRKLRSVADEHAAEFSSPGFTQFFEMLRAELSDDFLDEISELLRQLRFRNGVVLSARLGPGNVGIGYVLRKPDAAAARPGLIARLSGGGRDGYVMTVGDRDESGHRTLSDLSGSGITLVADALAQSADRILDFLTTLRAEVGFYLGCLNLRDQLARNGEPTCFPVPVKPGQPALSCRGLYDPCLALDAAHRVVGNDVSADGKALVMVTGANQGGKSTLLRSVGLAHLMMQCGMFVAAEAFSANACTGIFTHFKRPEDAGMTSGKLDEELRRMSEIVSSIRPGGLLLCNESFASTNEREGSEIARHIVRALLESGVKIFFVTHFFDLADGFRREEPEGALFLRAERRDDGSRTFRVIAGSPRPTSHARDVYETVFGASGSPSARQCGPLLPGHEAGPGFTGRRPGRPA